MRTPVLVALFALAGVARAAHAECAMPGPTASPASGALPPRPTVYLFEPYATDGAHRPVAVESGGQPVRFSTRDLTMPGADLRVTAIALDRTAGPVQLRAGELTWTYQVTADAPAPPTNAPRDVSITWEQSAWTCSHTEGLRIVLHPIQAAAFRVRWNDGAEAILPPDVHAYFRAPDEPTDTATLFLGHPSCAGYQIAPDHVGRRDFTLEALHADGTSEEVALSRVATAPDEPGSAAHAPARAADARATDATRTTPATRPRTWPWLVALTAALAIFTLAIARRRRRAIVP